LRLEFRGIQSPDDFQQLLLGAGRVGGDGVDQIGDLHSVIRSWASVSPFQYATPGIHDLPSREEIRYGQK